MKLTSASQSVDMPDGLQFASDQMPGFTRTKRGKSFVYRHANGQQLRDAKHIARIKKLAIPPAYTSVWICPNPQGHIQATGRDARSRESPKGQKAPRVKKAPRKPQGSKKAPRVRS